jgi:hypothetical protein
VDLIHQEFGEEEHSKRRGLDLLLVVGLLAYLGVQVIGRLTPH